MGKIAKKEGNLIYGKFPQNNNEERENEVFQEAVNDNVVSMKRHQKIRDEKPYTAKELWINYGAVACVLMVFGGSVVFNFKKSPFAGGGRGLASAVQNKEFEGEIVQDLNLGRRELSSIGGKPQRQVELEEREAFELQTFQSYHVSFDVEGYIQEIQLKTESTPVYMRDISVFIHDYQQFFPPHQGLVEQSRHFDESQNLFVSHYLLEGSRRPVQAVFQTDPEDKFISLVLEPAEI